MERSQPEADEKSVGEVKIKASLRENAVIVSLSEDVEGLSLRGYGVREEDELTLTFYEALFLLGKAVIEVEDEKTKKTMGFQELLKRFQLVDDNAWIRYLIYRDMRSRGYVAREGFGLGIDFRVYNRGEYGKATAKYLIFGIQEGQPVSAQKLARILQYAHSLKKNLVLAVINRRGEIVYYSLSQLTLK